MVSSQESQIIPSLKVVVAAGLTVLLFGLPLPYGGVTPAALLTIRLSAAGLLGVTVFIENGWRVLNGLKAVLYGLAGMAALALFQSARWPIAVSRFLSPRHAELVVESARAVQVDIPSSASLSLAPAASRSVALTTLALAAFLVVGGMAGRHLVHRRWMAFGLLAGGSLQVFLGLRPWLAGDVPRLRGAFVNPDHLCTYLEIALCVAIVVTWGLALRSRSSAPLEARILGVAGAAGICTLLFVGLLLTGSRAGLLSAIVGVSVSGMLLGAAHRRRRLAVIAPIIGLGLLVPIVATSGALGLGRLLRTSWHEVLFEDRPQVWLEAVTLVTQFPLVGAGLGAFEEAFSLVQHRVATDVLWARAHNDPLELWICGGFVGVLLAGLIGYGLLRQLLRVLWRGERSEDRLAAVAALSALAATGTHELFDFGLSLPANAAALTIVVGAAATARLNPTARVEQSQARHGSARETQPRAS